MTLSMVFPLPYIAMHPFSLNQKRTIRVQGLKLYKNHVYAPDHILPPDANPELRCSFIYPSKSGDKMSRMFPLPPPPLKPTCEYAPGPKCLVLVHCSENWGRGDG